MIVFPNCKINLGLHILRKRNDGYHDLETIFYPVPLTDILEIIVYHEHDRSSSIPFSVSGLAIDGDSASNLCLKAYWLLKKDFPDLPHIQMHLHKVIPAGSGLGGGSADASFALKVFNTLFNLKLTDKQLMEYGMELGSDCPFFIINKPCIATGRGEIMEEISIDLSGYKIILVNPGIHINTGDAFRGLRPQETEKNLKEVIMNPVEKWKDELINDFEKVIFKKHREIVDIKDQLYIKGASYASMSGSGSTVFGLFPKQKNPRLSFPENYFVKELLLD
jgi:4-diphosphocytidyl-2-C-methyl-D-erythritol kinase